MLPLGWLPAIFATPRHAADAAAIDATRLLSADAVFADDFALSLIAIAHYCRHYAISPLSPRHAIATCWLRYDYAAFRAYAYAG